MHPRDRLLARIGDINDFDRPRPLVTLEEFFEGNDDSASIGYNLPDHPQPHELYALLLDIRRRREVADVLIEVKDLEDPDRWPASDTVWIITSVMSWVVRRWFPARLAPDDLRMEATFGVDTERAGEEVPRGLHAIRAWYD